MVMRRVSQVGFLVSFLFFTAYWMCHNYKIDETRVANDETGLAVLEVLFVIWLRMKI